MESCRSVLTRLLSIALAFLIVAVLPPKTQDCCDPSAAGLCHHSKAPKHNAPCQPTLSFCADAECLTEQRGSVSVSANVRQIARDAAALAQPIWSWLEICGEQIQVWREPCARGKQAKLFLLNRVIMV